MAYKLLPEVDSYSSNWIKLFIIAFTLAVLAVINLEFNKSLFSFSLAVLCMGSLVSFALLEGSVRTWNTVIITHAISRSELDAADLRHLSHELATRGLESYDYAWRLIQEFPNENAKMIREALDKLLVGVNDKAYLFYKHAFLCPLYDVPLLINEKDNNFQTYFEKVLPIIIKWRLERGIK